MDAPAVVLSSGSLKRAGPDAADGEGPHKRVHIDVKEPVVGEVIDNTDDDDEEEEVEFIEVGKDGLRTVQDCIRAVFPRGGGFVCQFCL